MGRAHLEISHIEQPLFATRFCFNIYIYIHPGSSIVAPPTISRIVDHRHLALKLTRNRNSFFAPYTVHEVFETIYCSGNKCCSGLKSFDSHETCHQGTDLDDNFGAPYSVLRRFRKSHSRGRFRPSRARKFTFPFFPQIFSPGPFSKWFWVQELPRRFLHEN